MATTTERKLPQCQRFIERTQRQCLKRAVFGTEYCFHHQPRQSWLFFWLGAAVTVATSVAVGIVFYSIEPEPRRLVERVGLELAFDLPADNELMSGYRARLDAGLDEFTSLTVEQQQAAHGRTVGFMGSGPTIRGVNFRQIGLNSASSLFPNGSESLVRNALMPLEIDIAFYASDMNPAGFRPSRLKPDVLYMNPRKREREPDLEITEAYELDWPWLLIRHTRPDFETGQYHREYQLRSRLWMSNRSLWKEGEIQYVADLVGAQMFVDIGERGGQLTSQFELKGITVYVNNRPLAISVDDATKHISAEGYPFWEFRLPQDRDKLFRE